MRQLPGRSLPLVALLVAVPGCVADPGFEAEGETIVNGAPSADYPAVGMLRFAARSGAREARWGCTATLIEPSVLVTAAHCFAVPPTLGVPDSMAVPIFGLGPSGRDQAAPVVWNELSRVNDVAVAVVRATYPGPFLSPGPIGVNGNGRPEGRSVLMIGYGETAAGARDGAVRRGGWNTIQSVSETSFTTYALTGRADQADACHGDSGGPVIPWDPSFIGPVVPTFVGVISRAARRNGGCGSGTVHARVDAAASTISAGLAAARTGETGLQFEATGGGFVDAWCDDEECVLQGDAEPPADDPSDEPPGEAGDEPAGDDGNTEGGGDGGAPPDVEEPAQDEWESGAFNPECTCDLSYECEPDDWDPTFDCACDPDCAW